MRADTGSAEDGCAGTVNYRINVACPVRRKPAGRFFIASDSNHWFSGSNAILLGITNPGGADEVHHLPDGTDNLATPMG